MAWRKAAGHADRATPLKLYCTGLLLPGERKSVEPMAARLVDSQPLGSTPLLGLGVDDLRWPKPVRPGDTINAETEIISIRRSQSQPGYGIVRMRVTARNQRGEIVYVMTTSLWVPSRNP